MKRKSIMKVVGVFILGTVIINSLAGCEEKNNDADKNESIISGTVDNDSSVANSENSSDSTVNSTDLNIGDTVTFGSYEQDNDTSNGAEPIEWQVADINEGKALLISSYVLDNLEYNELEGVYGNGDSECLPWSSSYIHSWLNNDFASAAFTNEELQFIVDTTDYSSEDAEIIGAVFLLSYEEAVKYLELDKETVVEYDNDGDVKSEYELCYSDKALCQPTPYAITQRVDDEEFTQFDADEMSELGFNCDSSVIGKTYSSYWLRSSLGWDSWFTAEGHALCIEENGSLEVDVASFSNDKTRRHGVRPCIWVSLYGFDDSAAAIDDTTETEITSEQDNSTEANNAIEKNNELNLANLSFLCGSPNRVEITARKYNIKIQENTDENKPGYYEAEIDIIDTGSSYLLGIEHVKCYFGVSDYRSFIDNAVEEDGYTEDENGRMTYNYKIIKGNETLTCLGENFTLVSYYVNDMGRGNCEFVGEDGETYYLYNDISSYSDDFTGEMYYKIVTEDGQAAYREIEFDEGTYIEIPYDMAEGTGMKQFAASSPDENSGNPGGYYYMQFDSNGNVTKVQGW